MGHDPFSPISLAQVNILCLPVGKLTAARFEEYIRALRAFSIVALKNIPNTSSFSKYKEGHVILNIAKTADRTNAIKSKSIDINAEPQIVIGLIDGETSTLGRDGTDVQWLGSALATLQQTGAAYGNPALTSLVKLGGDRVPSIRDVHFVDLEGNGPSLAEVMLNIVGQFQSQLEEVVRPYQELLAQSTPPNADHRLSSVNGSHRGSITGRNTPGGVVDSQAASTGLNGGSSNEQNHASARAAVLMGQLSLQAGQWPEGLRHFTEGAMAARDHSNHLWYAKALEGLLVCMLLFAWAHLDSSVPQICYQSKDRRNSVPSSSSMVAICVANRSVSAPLSGGTSVSSARTLTLLIPQLLNSIISLYERAASILQDEATFMSLCQARIKWANLLLAIKKHGSSTLDDAALQLLVEGHQDAMVVRSRDPAGTSLVLHAKALSKLYVDASLEAQSRLSVQQAATLQMAIASSLSKLGVERKQAFYLKDFLQRLGPALIEARRVGAAEAGIHPSAGLPPLDSVGDTSGRTTTSGIQTLLESVCQSYGLPGVRSSFQTAQQMPKDRLRDAFHLWCTAHQAGDAMIKVDILSVCMDVADAVPDLQGSLKFLSFLLQISAANPTLSNKTPSSVTLVSSSDQARLLNRLQRAVNTADRFDIPNVRASYWDKCLVRFVELFQESRSNRLIPRTARDLSLVSAGANDVRKDPFIFNPFAKMKSGVGQSVIVVGEQARFTVILQNPLQVDVEIEDITLVTEGCSFRPDHHNIVLGPLCMQAFALTGTALEQGDITITGCRATVQGCHTEDFLIVQGDWKPSVTTKQMTRTAKFNSLSETDLPDISRLSIKATAPLPKLSIVSTSLLQPSLMLLEGERTAFTMTLQNESDLDVDFVLLTFEDSVSQRLEEALSNKDLLPADLYEIQNQIATRPVIQLASAPQHDKKMAIKARDMTTFTLELFGRPGLTEVTVVVDYAFLGKTKEEMSESFYTRQLRYTISTTINGSIDIPRCSVLALEGDFASMNSQSSNPASNNMLSAIRMSPNSEEKQCILLLDVRNIWPQPLDVDFRARMPLTETDNQNDDGWKDAYIVSETLQPGQMTRLLLMVPRILITQPYTQIPSLDTKRQFVVSASKMTLEAEAASRESFWYREELLKCVKATWKEPNGSRRGQVDMRKGIRLSPRMIDVLRIDLVEVSFSLKVIRATAKEDDAQSSSVRQIGNSHFSLMRNNFASLVTKIHNRSNEALRLLLRLQPAIRHQPHSIALDLSKRFAWTGVLQSALHPTMQAGEIREVELGVIALAEGEYEINGTVEEIRARSTRLDHPTVEVGSGADRRIWYARKPCLIDAVDAV